MCRLCLVKAKIAPHLANASALSCARTASSSLLSRRPFRMFSSTTESTPTSNESAATLEKTLAEKEAKLKEVSDSYLRLLADMENLRTRTKKEVESASQFAVTKFAKDVISVADVMEMALKSVDPEHPLLAGPAAERAESDVDSPATPNPPNGNGDGIAGKYEQLIKGLGMTLEEVRKVLKKHGVVPIEPLHQRFDPNLHNALFQVPTGDVEAGVVVSVAKKGYLLHHRVLRAADVGVSRKP